MRFFVPDILLQKYHKHIFEGNFNAFGMFIDISGFTAMTQKLMKNGKEGAEILSGIINEIFYPAIEHIYNNKGFITTFAGDAFTALFHVDNPQRVLKAATRINKEFDLQGKKITKFGEFTLAVKIGLSYGNVDWNIIQNKKQNGFYFSGSAVDRAAQSEHLAHKGDIIFDFDFKEKLKNMDFDYVSLSNNYFKVKHFEQISLPNYKVTFEEYSQSDFMPESILNFNSKGEFRDIVSCFISFKESQNLKSKLSQIITLSQEYGGYFNKIDFGDKGGVALVIFGAPIAQENLFTRACDFALAISEIKNFSLKVGMTFGTVFTGLVGSPYRMEYTALGMVVNLSARFAIFADKGEILIDNPILKSIQNDYISESIGKREFKGFNEPIAVYQLKKKLSSHLKPAFSDEMTGRKEELDRLYDFIKPIFHEKRSPGIVYIDGPAGIGKTRLIDALKQKIIHEKKLDENDFLWLFMPCDEILKKSFNPVIYMLQDYFLQSNDDSIDERMEKFEKMYAKCINSLTNEELKQDLIHAKSLIGGLLDLHWENSIYEQLDAKNRYENTLFALKSFIQAQSMQDYKKSDKILSLDSGLKTFIKAQSLQRPVILEIDDAHWIDADSQKWIETLMGNISDFPITVIAGCRFLDNGSKFEFNAPKTNFDRITLYRFDNKTAKEFINRKIMQALSKEFTEIDEKIYKLIIEKSGGNPFYIEQIVLYLIEKKIIDYDGKLVSENISIPAKINTIIVARIDRLTEDIKNMIKTASVLGKEFYLNILSEMLKNQDKFYQDNNIGSIVKKCEKEDIIAHIQELKYVFKHALIRETIYEIQLKQRLRDLHKLAAETIKEIYRENLDSHYDDLAYHFESAEKYTEALECLSGAILFAKQNFRNKKAMELIEKKLSIYENHFDLELNKNLKDYIETLLGKKYLLQISGDIKNAEKAVLEAENLSNKLNDKKVTAKVYLDIANILKIKGNFEKALSYLDKAQAFFFELDDKLMLGLTYLDLGIVYFWLGKTETAFEYFNKELDTFVALNVESRISEAYGNLGVMYRYVHEFDKAMYYLNKQLEIVKKLDDKIQLARTYSNIGWVYEGTDRFDSAIKYYEDSLKINRELGLKLEITRILDNMGYLFQKLRKEKKAITYHKEALNIAMQTDDIESVINIYANLGHAYKALKKFSEAHENYDNGIKLSIENKFNHPLPELYVEKGETYIIENKEIKAIEFIEKGRDIAKELNSDMYLKKAEEFLNNFKRRKL